MVFEHNESLLIQIVVSLIAIATFYYVLEHLRKKGSTQSFHDEYEEILHSEKHKVKGRWD